MMIKREERGRKKGKRERERGEKGIKEKEKGGSKRRHWVWDNTGRLHV